jgi:hypothetical protein
MLREELTSYSSLWLVAWQEFSVRLYRPPNALLGLAQSFSDQDHCFHIMASENLGVEEDALVCLIFRTNVSSTKYASPLIEFL